MSSGNLHTLIHSLTKSEKAYFKKFTSIHGSRNENNYIKLFSVIEKQKEYDETAIRNRFKNEKFIKQLHVTKGYLYKLILKSMRNYNSYLSTNIMIKEYISDIYYLMGKRLFNDAMKELYRTKTLAYKSEKYIELLEILDIEKNLIRRINRNNQLETLNSIYDEENNTLQLIKTEKELLWLYRKITTVKRMENVTDKKSKNFPKLAEIVSKAQDLAKGENLSLKSNIYFNQILVAYYFSIPDYDNAYKYSKQLVELIESSPLQLSNDPMSYITAALNLIALNHSIKQDEFRTNLEKLKLLPSRIKKELTDLDKNYLRLCLLNEEIIYCNRTGQLDTVTKIINENSQYIINEEKKLDASLKIMLFLNIAITYFSAGEFEISLNWVNKILNDKQLSLIKPHYYSTIYLNLLIHFELGNYDLLDSNILSVYRRPEEKEEMEVIILTYLKKLADKEKEEEKYIYNKFRKSITSLYKELNIDDSKTIFSITDWIDRKIKT